MIVVLVVATAAGWLKVPTMTQVSGVKNALIYMITLAGVIAVFAWNMGNRVIGAINGILFMNLVPIVAFVIIIINGYKVSGFEIIGCLITISALIGNNSYNRYVAHKKLTIVKN